MTNFIKKEQLVGSQKVVVGEKYNDLVLRTLGKVYIQTGSKFTLLTEYLDKAAGKASADNILIWNDESDLTDARYPGDGVFVFTASSKSLYLTYEGVYIPIIETDAADVNWGNIADKFVSKSGDYIDNYLNVNGLLNASDGTFSNPVTIKSKTAPLKVFSKEMVENFNSEHVGGKRIDEIAVKAQNESILGKWNFANITSFKDRVNFSNDLVNGDGFAPGFTGYGWMLDTSTCTLTIDNLIVRKAMHVYELVVNKISATNGSLWVSDSAKIKECESIEPYKDLDDEGNEIIINHPLYEERESPDFNKTPSYPESNSDFEGEEDLNGNTLVNIYDTYFTGSFYYILLDGDYCPFRLNDLLRCQRFTGQSIKYYDGIVTNVLNSNEIIIRLSPSLNDTYNNVKTEVVESEDEEGNKFQELKTTVTNKPQNQYEEVLDEEGNVIDYKEVFTTTYDKSLTSPEEGDGLVRIGNSSVRDRMGAVYITSSDVGGPYIDILSEVITPNFNKITKYNESENKEVIHKCLKTRLGNLNNIYDPDFIQQPYGYGLYSENVFLKGKFVQVDSSGSTKPIPIYKGIWKEFEQYYHGDQVTHNGELYYALKSSRGNDPSLYPVYWELTVSKGEDGEPGQPGQPGEPGAAGPSLTFFGQYNPIEKYPLSLTNRVVVFILSDSGENKQYYQTKLMSSPSIIENQHPLESDYWESFGGNFQSIATGTLLAEGANIANFIFKDEVMRSQDETVFNGKVVPNLTLDGKTGKITALDGSFRGVINALSGTFGDSEDNEVFEIKDTNIIGRAKNENGDLIDRIKITTGPLPDLSEFQDGINITKLPLAGGVYYTPSVGYTPNGESGYQNAIAFTGIDINTDYYLDYFTIPSGLHSTRILKINVNSTEDVSSVVNMTTGIIKKCRVYLTKEDDLTSNIELKAGYNYINVKVGETYRIKINCREFYDKNYFHLYPIGAPYLYFPGTPGLDSIYVNWPTIIGGGYSPVHIGQTGSTVSDVSVFDGMSQTVIANDGFCSYWGPNTYFYFSKSAGLLQATNPVGREKVITVQDNYPKILTIEDVQNGNYPEGLIYKDENGFLKVT